MRLFLLIFSFVIGGCFAKSFDPTDPDASFVAARESFDAGDHELAITRLGSFKSRFPYSKLAAEAELLIADALYALARYPEALLAYQRFVRLRPPPPPPRLCHVSDWTIALDRSSDRS